MSDADTKMVLAALAGLAATAPDGGYRHPDEPLRVCKAGKRKRREKAKAAAKSRARNRAKP